MSQPPNDVPPSELFLKLQELPRPSEIIPFPRKDENGDPVDHVRLITLKMEDHDRAKSLAHQKMKARNYSNDDIASPALAAMYGDAVAKEVLAMCVVSKDEPVGGVFRRIFRDSKDVDQLNADEVAILFSMWQLVQHKFGPMDKMSQEDVDAWVKRLGEGGSAFPLLSLPLPDLADLTTSLAAKLFGVCQILASQLSSLPPTLVSALEIYLTDIGSFGELAGNSESTGTATSPDKTAVTMDNAVSLAQTLRD